MTPRQATPARPPRKRKCKAKTKAGKRCRSAPLTNSPYCIAHQDKETREKTRFGGAQPNAGRKPKPKPPDALRELLEHEVEVVLRPYFDVLGYDVVVAGDGELALTEKPQGGAKLYGTSSKDGYVNVSDHDDLGARLTAAEKLLDRVYGRPKAHVEASGPGGSPIQIQHGLDLRLLTDDELDLLAKLSAAVEARAEQS